MKILLINKFLYPKGGDSSCTLDTGRLLAERGHTVFYWGMKHPSNPKYLFQDDFIDNIDYLKSMSGVEKIKIALKVLYSLEAKKKISTFLKKTRPEIIHINNFAHQISPSILHIFKKFNIPIVMTMHDYKLVCPAYTMYLDGKPCERCKNSRYYSCFFNKCVKASYAKSLVNTFEMYLHHKLLGIYNLIDLYISPSEFLKNKLIDMGFKKKIIHLPNFLNLEEFIPKYSYKNELCYFGRLSSEKGLFTLINSIKGLNVKLKIIGTGPLEKELIKKVKADNINNIKFLGYKSGEELKYEITNSMAVILPSEWYENNPRSCLEAFALGKPVIGTKIGGIPELIKSGVTGLLFKAGDYLELRERIKYLLRNKEQIKKLGTNARKFVEENFSSSKHYKELINIYDSLLD